VAPRDGLLSGTVTFLFTDIEGSTELLKRLGRDQYATLLAAHAEVLRAAVEEHGGRVEDTQGDAMFCTFRSAREAVTGAIQGQRALAAHEWPEQVAVRVRMGLHSGEPRSGDEGYVGIGVHRAARIGAAAHGGQVLLSETARALVADDLPAGVSLRDLGLHRLKDIDEPARLYQVVADGLQGRFPPPRPGHRGRNRRTRLALAAAALIVAGAVVAGVLLATRAASAKPVRLLANSIVVIDAKSRKTVGDVPLGFTPTDVDAGGNKIWVLNGAAHTVTSIDPDTLKVVQTVGVDGSPSSQYAAGSTDWVGVPGGVNEIDEGGESAAIRISLWKPTGGAAQCFVYVTGDGKTVWVSEGTNVAVLDGASGNVLRKLRLPPPAGISPSITCYGLRYSGGELAAIRNDFTIGRVDLSTASYTPVATDVALGAGTFRSSNWAAGFGSYWLGSYTVTAENGQENNLTRLDPTSGQVLSKIAGPLLGSTVVDTTGIWTAAVKPNTATGQVSYIDPHSNQIVDTIPLPHTPCCPNGAVGIGIAAGHGRIWVGLESQ
jgi:class 3 adenylate cyclase